MDWFLILWVAVTFFALGRVWPMLRTWRGTTEADCKLPCDVKIGAIRFRKGCKLSTLTNRARAWLEIATHSRMDHTAQSSVYRKFNIE